MRHRASLLFTLTDDWYSDLTLGAGGAITHLSDVDKEWEEVLIKMEAVLGTA